MLSAGLASPELVLAGYSQGGDVLSAQALVRADGADNQLVRWSRTQTDLTGHSRA
jgi:hypothetical protein